ncbi:2-(1,2-epoxy-1,2-dihydrophenyl)acetyl-CoA isomerase [Thermomonospora echinospora]|uniref:2-(1,2-epoxy-1,2-dihydrophenyl)acetyl-CoA isomerase n=1 Tax=Thermomonospora echinospora TaxID=1992 RepID=A0A1H5TAS4_9ACTN|nr:enoyl-CoA hydratase-related protein [Thermomonospora echinospora]SEF59087.1 2-(1,2-epoxy-1,2-dihydrophenyl)acetyl-CoA isomerase [Thermomonospora echinospora]
MAESPTELLWQVTVQGVARLTLNRPKAGNSITAGQREEIIGLLGRASGDPRVRAIVLTGAGERHFCTGADLSGSTGPLTDDAPPDAPERPAGSVARAVAGGAQRLITAVLDCDKPVIAAVNGTAAGLGCHLAYACDLVLAADSARFIEVFVRRGLVVDGAGAYLLARLVGPQRAKELVFFGDDLPAAEAHRMGLINRIVPAGELDKTAEEWAVRLAAGPTVALGLGKRLINRSLEVDRTTALAEEAMAAEINMTSEDGREGLRAFAERRAPVFRGW